MRMAPPYSLLSGIRYHRSSVVDRRHVDQTAARQHSGDLFDSPLLLITRLCDLFVMIMMQQPME